MGATEKSSSSVAPAGRPLCLTLLALTATFLGLCTAPPVFAGQDGEAPAVRAITVEGTYLLPRSTVLGLLELREGQPLDKARLDEVVRQLNNSGLIGTVSVEQVKAGPGEVELRVSVAERVKLTRVQFRGNDEVSAARLQAALGIRATETVDPAMAKGAQEKLNKLYAEMGYPLASAEAYVRFTEEGERILVFDVVEGPRAWVRQIRFQGNKVFDEDELLDVMKSRRRKWPAFIWPGRFDEAAFKNDLWQVEDKYYRAGYLDARVGGYWSHSEDLRTLWLHVTIYEGPRYTTEDISFEGNTVFRADEMLNAIPLVAGEPFLPDKLDKSKKIIREMYGRQGYVDVGDLGKNTLRDNLVFDETAPRLKVQFSIAEGEPVFIRRVRVEGLERTDELVVIRNLTFFPGDRVNTDTLEESERVLKGTGYFDLSDPKPVDIHLEPDQGALRDAVVRVREGMTGMFTAGLGISTDAGLMGQIAYEERNFDIHNWPTNWNDLWRGNALRGGGQTLKVRLALGSRSSSFLISFFDPAVNHSLRSFGAKLYSTVEGWDMFDLRRSGASVKLGKKLSRRSTRGFEFGLEAISMTEVDDDAPPEILRDDDSFLKPFAAIYYEVDKRDSRIWPSEGWRGEARAEMGFVDVQAIKLTGEVEKYWTLRESDWGKHVLKLRGMAGIMESYAGRIPVFERFYAGGQNSLRGFALRGASPVDGRDEDQIGGQSMLIGSIEYILPTAEENLKLAFFMDAGWVSEGPADILMGLDDLRASVGFGIRWLFPALGNIPLTIDVALPIMTQDGDDTQAIHFSLGTIHTF